MTRAHSILLWCSTCVGAVALGFAAQAGTVSGSSGSINVRCDQWGAADASVSLPAGARFVSASAKWKGLSNIKESKTGQVHKSGRTYSASGKIRGLDKEHTLGVEHCPGGGHGTLVINLKYQ